MPPKQASNERSRISNNEALIESSRCFVSLSLELEAGAANSSGEERVVRGEWQECGLHLMTSEMNVDRAMSLAKDLGISGDSLGNSACIHLGFCYSPLTAHDSPLPSVEKPLDNPVGKLVIGR